MRKCWHHWLFSVGLVIAAKGNRDSSRIGTQAAALAARALTRLALVKPVQILGVEALATAAEVSPLLVPRRQTRADSAANDVARLGRFCGWRRKGTVAPQAPSVNNALMIIASEESPKVHKVPPG
jgi:hypothetical protein